MMPTREVPQYRHWSKQVSKPELSTNGNAALWNTKASVPREPFRSAGFCMGEDAMNASYTAGV